MSWGQQGPSTHQLPSRMGNLGFPVLLYPMAIQMHINLPYFRVVASSTPVGNTNLSFLLLYFYSLPDFSVLPSSGIVGSDSCTLVLAWYLALTDWRLLQFHCTIPTASVLRVIFPPLDWYWQWNWYSLWCFGCFLGSFWDHHIHPKLLSQESTKQSIVIGPYWSL